MEPHQGLFFASKFAAKTELTFRLPTNKELNVTATSRPILCKVTHKKSPIVLHISLSL
jgi:hypothetical protein